MFGYLDVQRDKLSDGERGLWHAFMCGECISTKKLFGNLPRVFVNHDITFFNVLFHSICGLQVETEKLHCLSHPIKKQTIVTPTDLMDSLSAANVILMYWNLYDDAVDGGGVEEHGHPQLFGVGDHPFFVFIDSSLELFERKYRLSESFYNGNSSYIFHRFI